MTLPDTTQDSDYRKRIRLEKKGVQNVDELTKREMRDEQGLVQQARQDRRLEKRGELNYQQPGYRPPNLSTGLSTGTQPATGVSYVTAPTGLVIKEQYQTVWLNGDPALRAEGPTATGSPFASLQDVQQGTAQWSDVAADERKKILNDPKFYKSGEIANYPSYMQQQLLTDPNFRWDQLPGWQKTYWKAMSNPYIMASPMALAGARAGGVLGPLGKVAGAAIGYGLGVIGGQQYDPTGGVFEQPTTVAGMMAVLNKLAEGAEQSAGYVSQLADAAIAGAQGNEQAAEAARKMIADPAYRKATWEAGRITYEASDFLGARNWIPGLARLLGDHDAVLAAPGQDFIIGAASPVDRNKARAFNPVTGNFYDVTDSMGILQEARLSIHKAIVNGEDYREVVRQMLGDQAQYVGAQTMDFAGQMAIDPLEQLPLVTNAASMSLAKVLGNETAARAFSETYAPIEAARRYKTLVETGDVAPGFDYTKMGSVSRWIAGITPEGKVRAGAFTKTGLLDTRPDLKHASILTKIKEDWAALTPEARAREGANMFYNNLGALLSTFDDPHAAVKFLKTLAGSDMKTWSKLGDRVANSPEWYTILPALKAFQVEHMDGLLAAWDLSAPNRDALTTLTSILGEDPGKFIEDLSKRGTIDADFQRIVQRLRESNAPQAKALLKQVETGLFTPARLAEVVDLFTGDGALFWHPDQFKAALMDKLGEHFDGWVVDRLQLGKDTPESKAFFRTTHLLKSAQSVLLLGGSPGYAIQNGLSNMVHRAATGIYGYLTPAQMDSWLDRFGVKPGRLEEGFGMAGMLDEGMQAKSKSPVKTEAIEQAMGRGKNDALGKAQRAVTAIGKGMPFNKLSAWFERVEGKNGFVIAMRQMWSRTWRRGQGFRLMTPELKRHMEAAGIDANKVYALIEAGMNKKEITDFIYGRQRGLMARTLVHDAAQSIGMTSEDAATMLEKVGVLDELDSLLRDAVTPDRVRLAFERAARKAQDYNDMQTARDLRSMAEDAQNKVEAEGAPAALDIVQRVNGEYFTAWLDHYSRFGEVFDDIKTLDDPAMRNKAIELNYEKSDREFRRITARTAAQYQGIFEAWGRSQNITTRKILAAIAQVDAAMKHAYKFMREQRKEHFEKYRGSSLEGAAAWGNLQSRISAEFDVAFKKKIAAEGDMGDALQQVYTEMFGKAAGAAAKRWWRDYVKFSSDIIKRERAARAEFARLPKEEREIAKKRYYGTEKVAQIVELEAINKEGIARLERVVQKSETPKKGKKAPARQAPVDEEAAALIAEEERIQAEEKAARDAQVSAVWTTAEEFNRIGLPFDRTVLQDRFALLDILKKDEFGGYPDLVGLDDVRLTPDKVREILGKRNVLQQEKAVANVTNAANVANLIKMDRERQATPEQIARARNMSLLQAIRAYGGIDISVKDVRADITGEKKAKGWQPGIFSRTGKNRWGLDQIARMLADDGYPIDLNSPDDPGGVNQLIALMQQEFGGEKVYSLSRDIDLYTQKYVDEEARLIESLAEDIRDQPAEEAMNRAAIVEDLLAPPFDVDTWGAQFESAAREGNLSRVYELIGDFPPERGSDIIEGGETYNDFMSRVADEAAARVAKDVQDATIAEHLTRGEFEIADQQQAAEVAMTRQLLFEKYKEAFPNVDADQINDWMEVSDAALETIGRYVGETKEEMYTRYQAVLRSEGGRADLMQIATVNRRMRPDEIAEYARALVRAGEDELRRAVRNEGERADKIAILDAAHKLNDRMAENVARATLFQFDQAAKGGVDFVNGRAIIHAWESGDLSTIVHENGHIFLEMMRDAATRTGDRGLLDDLTAFDDWARIEGSEETGWKAVNGNGQHVIRRRADGYAYVGPSGVGRVVDTLEDAQYILQQEMFARGFERYLAEGKAPTPRLRVVFEKFKTWMLSIYKSLTGSHIDVGLTPEMRGVFDRMLGAERSFEFEADRREPAYQQLRAKWDTMDATERSEAAGWLFEKTMIDPVSGVETNVSKAMLGKPDGWFEAESDLNALKAINDTFGHDVGDKILEGMGRIAKEEVEKVGGRVFRTGGDEFTYYFPTEAAARVAMDAIDRRMGEAEFDVAGTKKKGFTISYGIGLDAKAADTAMYMDKARRVRIGQRVERPVTPLPASVVDVGETVVVSVPDGNRLVGEVTNMIDDGSAVVEVIETIQQPAAKKKRVKKGDKIVTRQEWIENSGKQTSMFEQTQADLPLFSGTPPPAVVEVFAPRPTIKQESMFETRPEFGERFDENLLRVKGIEPETKKVEKIGDIIEYKGKRYALGEVRRGFDGDLAIILDDVTPGGYPLRRVMNEEAWADTGYYLSQDLVVRADNERLRVDLERETPAATPEVQVPAAKYTDPRLHDIVEWQGKRMVVGFVNGGEKPTGLVKLQFENDPARLNQTTVHIDDLKLIQRADELPSSETAVGTMEQPARASAEAAMTPAVPSEAAGLAMRNRAIEAIGQAAVDRIEIAGYRIVEGEQTSSQSFRITGVASANVTEKLWRAGLTIEARPDDITPSEAAVPADTAVDGGTTMIDDAAGEALPPEVEDLAATSSTPEPAMTDRTGNLLAALNEKLVSGDWFEKSRDFEAFIKHAGFDLESESDLNLAYDLMEGAFNLRAREIRANLETLGSPLAERLVAMERLESTLTEARRTLGKMKLQQFSTPLTISEAAAHVADVRPGDTVGEPTAGTANLVDMFATRKDVTVRVNEIDPGRQEVLRRLGYEPTSMDLMSGDWVIENGKKAGPWADVVISNPPWGSYSTGKYGKAVNTPVKLNDWSQRFTYLTLMRMPEGGRFVGVMPANWLYSIDRVTRAITDKPSEFYKWLKKNYSVRAVVESPPGAYKNRATDISSLLVVIDKTSHALDIETMEHYGTGQPKTWDDYAALVERVPKRTEEAVHHGQESIQARVVAGPDAAGIVDPAARAGKSQSVIENIGKPTEIPNRGRVVRGGDIADGERVITGDTIERSAGDVEQPAIEGGDRGASVVDEQPAGIPETNEPFAYSDSFLARINAGKEAVKSSGSFTEYVGRAPLQPGDTPHPHPNTVVETKGLAGVPYPELEEAYRPSPAVMRAMKNRTLSYDGNLDPVWAAIQQNDKHKMGMLIADDVGMGKSRSAAAFVIDRLEKGKKKILVVTKDEQNVRNLMDGEFPQVWKGTADENGAFITETPQDFPAKRIFLNGQGFPEVKKGEASPPVFDEPTVYFVTSSEFVHFAAAIKEIKPEVVVVDEAHLFKNVGTTARGQAWTELHKDWIGRQADMLYLTATPGVDLADLRYLYGLKIWSMDGFDDWIKVITGQESPEQMKQKQKAKENIDGWLQKVQDARERIDVEPVEIKTRYDTYEGLQVGEIGVFKPTERYNQGRYGFEYEGSTFHESITSETEAIIVADFVNKRLKETPGVKYSTSDVYRFFNDAMAQFQETFDPPGREDIRAVGMKDSSDIISKAEKGTWGRKGLGAFEVTLPPAHTEQIMRELKVSGGYMSRDISRAGVDFGVKEYTPPTEGKAAFNKRVSIYRRIYEAWARYGKMNQGAKKAAAMFGVNGDIQADAKRALFNMRLPGIIDEANAALSRGEQVVISVVSVSEVDGETGSLVSAIDKINTQKVEKIGKDNFSDPEEIPEALVDILTLKEDLKDLPALPSPVDVLRDSFGDRVAFVTGSTPTKDRIAAQRAFQRNKLDVIVISGAGKTGINLHDVTGKKRIHLIVGDYEWSATNFKQELGRVDRTGQQTSPIVTVMHTGSAGEKKFVATISNRMKGLGATSKGGAESTGTGMMTDAFELGTAIDKIALNAFWQELSVEQKGAFLDKYFRDPNVPDIPRSTLDTTSEALSKFLLGLQSIELDEANRIMDAYSAKRTELMESGTEADDLAARRAAASTGEIIRQVELGDNLRMSEVRNVDGQKYAIVDGVLTPHMNALRGVITSGADAAERYIQGGNAWMRWVQFYDEGKKAYVSGLQVKPSKIKDVAEYFGKVMGSGHKPETAVTDLKAGDRIKIIGANGSEWELYMGRGGAREDKIVIDNARIRDKDALMKNGASFNPIGNFFFVTEANLAAFFQRFPIRNEAPETKPTLYQDFNPLEGADKPFGTMDDASAYLPESEFQDQGWKEHINPLLDAMQTKALENLAGRQPFDGGYKDMSREGQEMLRQYIGQVENDMSVAKASTMKWGESQRDFAMLNYNRRYGFDTRLEAGVPYELFYTRALMTWAMRGLDKPVWYARYARIRNQQNKYERDIPERLRNKFAIPAPWLPKWMGDSLYVDPLQTLFTPANFIRPVETMIRDKGYQAIETERILQEWAADGKLSEDQVAEAMRTRSGTVWERAASEAGIRRESEIASPFDFFSSIFGPAWYLSAPLNLMGIEVPGISKGEPNKVSNLPITNTARALETVTKDTWAEPIGKFIGLFGKPEQMLREKFNMPEFGEFGDYYIDRQLANMVADGVITSDQAQIAMIERKGEFFEQARERVKMELAMRVPLAGATYAATHKGPVGAAQAFLPSLFGAGLLPAGELEFRGLKDEWNDAWKKYDNGDKTAINRFFEDHPEYEAYLAKGKEPEEKLRTYMIGNIWDAYMSLGDTNKKAARAQMGEEFAQAFLDKETRNYETIDIETLVQWSRMLGGMVPQTPQTQPALEAPVKELDMYSPEVTRITDRFFEERRQNFPNYYELEQQYYLLPRSEQAGFLLKNPELAEYQKWRKRMYKEYPDLKPIFQGKVFKTIDTSDWSPALEEYVIVYAMTGQPMPRGAETALKQVWIREGQPYGDYKAWLNSQVVPALMYQQP